MALKINKVLSFSEIDTIDLRIRAGVTSWVIMISFKDKNQKEQEIIRSYIAFREVLTYHNKILGNKLEPYYESENDMDLPSYTLDDLSPSEKEILNSLNREEKLKSNNLNSEQ